MLKSKVIPLFIALVLQATTNFAQHFSRKYDCPQNGLSIYRSTETSTGFTIHTYSVNGQDFADLTIDSSGNNPQFGIDNISLFTTEKGFIRNPDQSVVLFDNIQNTDATIQFLNPSGTVLWTKEHVFTGTAGATVSGGKFIKGVRLSDGYLFLGKIAQTLPNGISAENLYALKTDWDGNVLFNTFNEYPFDLLYYIKNLTISGNRI